MGGKKMFFGGSKKYEPNTFIGGVALTSVTSASDYSVKSGLSINHIKGFKITGNDVSFRIDVDYQLEKDAFYNDNDITYINDVEGKIKELNSGCFRNCSNLEEAYLNGVTDINDTNNTSTSGCFRNCTSLEILQLNALHEVFGYFSFSNLTAMVYLDLPATFLKVYRFMFSNTDCGKINLSHITTGSTGNGLRAFQGAKGILNLTSFSTQGRQDFYAFEGTEIYLPALTSLSDKMSYFQNCSSLTLIDAKKLKNINSPSNELDMFLNLKSNCVINVHIDLATNNGGNADASLIYAKTVRSAVVNFYDNLGNYVSTL